MVPMGASDDPAGIERSRQDGAVRKVIEWSAHKALSASWSAIISISGWDELTC
jgi:hypothetical protein